MISESPEVVAFNYPNFVFMDELSDEPDYTIVSYLERLNW